MFQRSPRVNQVEIWCVAFWCIANILKKILSLVPTKADLRQASRHRYDVRSAFNCLQNKIILKSNRTILANECILHFTQSWNIIIINFVKSIRQLHFPSIQYFIQITCLWALPGIFLIDESWTILLHKILVICATKRCNLLAKCTLQSRASWIFWHSVEDIWCTLLKCQSDSLFFDPEGRHFERLLYTTLGSREQLLYFIRVGKYHWTADLQFEWFGFDQTFPGLVVKGRDSRSKGRGFKSRHCILDGHFSHIIVVKIVMFVWKRPKINEKEAGVGPFKKTC